MERQQLKRNPTVSAPIKKQLIRGLFNYDKLFFLTGSLRFECQHGERECEAFIIHCYAIEAIHDAETRLDFVVCMIRDNNHPQEAFQRVCATH